MSPQDKSHPVHAQLGLWDAVSIIIGIVIGSSIYVTPSFINGHLSSPWEVMGIWALGGVLGLIGALCYAELATTYPRMGGDYVYLNRAFGSWAGFLFGWAQIVAILTGSIGMMGFVFGEYAVNLFGIPSEEKATWTVALAFGAIAALALINLFGVVLGKTTQNILTIAKILGLGGIILAGLFWANTGSAWTAHEPTDKAASFGVALILVLYAYGGWNDAAFVASDMRNRRDIPKTLLLGTGGVMVIYLLVNIAYINGLGFAATQGFNPRPIAARTLGLVGELAEKGISVLVMVSALGAINGLLFTGSRVCTALGADHSVFAALGRVNPRFRSPVWSLLTLALVSMLMVLTVGTAQGRNAIDVALLKSGLGRVWYNLDDDFVKDFAKKSEPLAAKLPAFHNQSFKSEEEFLQALSQAASASEVEKHKSEILGRRDGPIPWKQYFGGFDTLFAGTAPVFWVFFLLTGISLFVLRVKDAHVERPFKTPLYPIVPLVFCAMCGYGIYSSMIYAKWVSLLGWVPLAIGVPLFLVSRYRPTEASSPASQ